MADIQLMRVYDIATSPPENSFLTDRLWPRGIAKARLAGVVWLKDVAPSTDLRKRFHTQSLSWNDFCREYYAELNAGKHWQPLMTLLQHNKTIVLLFGSKDRQHNQAVALRHFLLQKLSERE